MLGSAMMMLSALAMPATLVAKEKIPVGARHQETVVLGAGCFWGVEQRYAALPGVLDAVSGYADGTGVTPDYRAITAPRNKHNPDNHAEVVQVTFNPQVISLTDILQHFFENHDPTQVNRQGNDVGTQYRSLILTRSEQQATAAQQVLAEYQNLLSQAGLGRIATQIKPLQAFYPAEDYHQDYLAKNPGGYCPDHATGVRFTPAEVAPVDNQALLQGQQILVIDAPDCPFCIRFKQDVTDAYQGSIPLHIRRASQLQSLTLQTPTSATPTLVFLQDGKEVLARQGYVDAATFYRMLGAFKLGETEEAFRVAFEEGTDARFCQQYEAFKDTPDGVFVDKLSGVALFDTQYRFNSGSGWLSFTRAVPGAVYEKPDNRHGMHRVEVRSVVSDIHLGHVFADGPGGQPRYCINATVLEFQPR